MASALGRGKRDDPQSPWKLPAINEKQEANNGYQTKTQQELRDAGLLASRSGVTKASKANQSTLTKSVLPPIVPKRSSVAGSRISRLSQFSSLSTLFDISNI